MLSEQNYCKLSGMYEKVTFYLFYSIIFPTALPFRRTDLEKKRKEKKIMRNKEGFKSSTR
jgi:hypothetical protein